MTLRVLIVDDEAMARRRLARLLAAMPDVTVVGECADAVAALALAQAADVLLLDVQMPGLTGLEALALLPEGRRPVVILCTAHADYALEAFAGGARDYLLKPVEATRLRQAMDRASTALAPRAPAPSALPPRLAVETRQGVLLLDPADIESAELHDALVALRINGAVHLCARALSDLETALEPHGFVRVHRRALVNLRHVDRLEPDGASGYIARLASGHSVEVSRAAGRELRRRLRF